MKKLVMMMAMAAFGAAFGAANDTVLVFSTQGPDTYGDGSTVLDGERYALVWTKDGTAFAGLSADCKPLAETTKVIAVAPLAKDARCPETVFEIDADYAETLKGGSFALYLLDTRVEAGKLASASRRDADGTAEGLPTSVNATGAASLEGDAVRTGTGSVGSVKAGAVSLATVGVYTEVAAPEIATIKVTGEKIEIKVDGMVENHDYFVVPGASPSAFKSALSTKPVGDTFTFDAPKDATFFKVIGARKFR